MKILLTAVLAITISNYFGQAPLKIIPIETLNIKELKLCNNKDPLNGVMGRKYSSKNFIKYSYNVNADINKDQLESLLTNCFDSLRFLNPVNKISGKKITLDTTITTEQFTLVKGRTAIKDLKEREKARNVQIRRNFTSKKEYNNVYFVNINGLGDVFLISTWDGNDGGFTVTAVEKAKLILIDRSIKAKIRFEDSLEVIKIIGAERGNKILSENDDSKTAVILAKTLKKRLDYEKFQSKLSEFLSFEISMPEFKKQYRYAQDSVSKKQYEVLRQKVDAAILLAEEKFISDHHIVLETDFENEKSKVFVYSDENWSSAFDKEGKHLATDSIYKNGIPKNIIQFIPKHKSYYKPLEDDILKIKCSNVKVQMVINDTLYKVKRNINYISDTAFSKNRFRENFISTHYGNQTSNSGMQKEMYSLGRLLIWDNKFQVNPQIGVQFEINSKPYSEEKDITIPYVISFSLDELYDSYLKMHKIKKEEQAIRKAQREEEEKLAEAERLAQKKKLYAKYGKRYVDAAYDFEFIVGMHEDLANIIVQQLWDVHSSDQLGTGHNRYWLKPNSSVGTKRVMITIKNKKITKVSSW